MVTPVANWRGHETSVIGIVEHPIEDTEVHAVETDGVVDQQG